MKGHTLESTKGEDNLSKLTRDQYLAGRGRLDAHMGLPRDRVRLEATTLGGNTTLAFAGTSIRKSVRQSGRGEVEGMPRVGVADISSPRGGRIFFAGCKRTGTAFQSYASSLLWM